MKNSEEKTNTRPRVMVVFESKSEFEEFENYAKSKCLDIRIFLKFAGKAYMDKYPRSQGKPSRVVQPYA